VTAPSTKHRANLLVELLVEELPPKALEMLGNAFGRTLAQELASQGLIADAEAFTPYASPRRLAVHVRDVIGQAEAQASSTKLMPVSVAFKDGVATPAYRKKLAALGRPHLADAGLNAADGPDRIEVRSDGKADVLFLSGLAQGVSLQVGLQNALEQAIAKLPIPKVMTYQLHDNCEMPGWTSVSFVRPAHGVIALHGDQLVPVHVLGLQAGNVTVGHRFEARRNPVVIAHADTYADDLQRDGAVIAGFAARRDAIARQLAAACAELGGGVHVVDDPALLDEVTALVERPNVVVCSFDAQFLEVPQECLVLTMKANQKYFPLLDANERLTNRFLVVSNISPSDTRAVVAGNERVVRPRLADARFFFDQDRKKSLASRADGLSRVVYHNKLGSQGERMQRVRAIATAIVRALGDASLLADVDTAAQLAKTDLLTDMVGEFPELQGTMGAYYARHDGLGDAVAMAIEDHYKPRFAGDTLPRTSVGLVLALADKLETLVGMFGIGNLPTGDKDPFALRRHALGVVRMLVERALPLGPAHLVSLGAAAFPDGLLKDVSEPLGQFLVDRLKGYLKDGGHSSGEVDAAIHAQGLVHWAELPLHLSAVRAFAALPQAPALAAANKRIGNILKKVDAVDPHVSEVLLREPAERALHAAMQQCIPQAKVQFDAKDYTASLQTLAALRAPVDAFFEQVMVNAPEMDLRLNRLGLLHALHNAMNRVADLSRLDNQA
jgi:glycyl-tRNA synthetase beta chain